MAWSSVHGDVVGAFRTGVTSAVTKLGLTSKEVLLGGTWKSMLILWEIFETKMGLIPQKEQGKPNVFNNIMEKMEVQRASEEMKPEKEEDNVELLDAD